MQRENIYLRDEYIRKIENKELSLIELVKFVLVKWKLVLIICVVLYLGWVMGELILNNRTNSSLTQVSEEELTKDQQEKIYDIIEQKEELEKLKEYKSTSACMNLDPYACHVNTLQYLISEEQEGREIFEAYRTYAETGGLKKAIDGKLGSEIVSPSDLVSVTGNQLQIEKLEIFESPSCVLVLKIVTEDDAMNQKITDVVKNALEEYYKHLSSVIGKHDLILLSESNYVGIDNDIKQAQSDLDREIKEKDVQIKDNENGLSDSEKNLLKQLENDKERTEDEKAVPVKKQGKSIIWYFLILFICITVSCILFVCYYLFIFGSRLKDGEEIMSIFDLPYIGEISKKDLKTSVLRLNDEIESMCSEIKEESIFVSAMTNVDNMEECFSTMKDKLGRNGVEMLFGDNISESADSMKTARDCKNMILIFEERKTTYASIDSVLQRCNNWGIKVIGVMNISNK